MPTDDERREVAARLREMPNNATWTADRFGEALLQLLVYGNGRESFNRLADLIEPDDPKVMCVAEVKVDGELLEKLVHDTAVELTGIDRDALLALADEMEEARYDYPEADDALWRFADRVREACGEVSYEE